jgi:hypothetical protein
MESPGSFLGVRVKNLLTGEYLPRSPTPGDRSKGKSWENTINEQLPLPVFRKTLKKDL